MGSPYIHFPYSLTGTDPLAEANSQFINHCRQLANQQNVDWPGAQEIANRLKNVHLEAQSFGAQNAYCTPQLAPAQGKCAYCKTLFHERADQCKACGAPQ